MLKGLASRFKRKPKSAPPSARQERPPDDDLISEKQRWSRVLAAMSDETVLVRRPASPVSDPLPITSSTLNLAESFRSDSTSDETSSDWVLGDHEIDRSPWLDLKMHGYGASPNTQQKSLEEHRKRCQSPNPLIQI